MISGNSLFFIVPNFYGLEKYFFLCIEFFIRNVPYGNGSQLSHKMIAIFPRIPVYLWYHVISSAHREVIMKTDVKYCRKCGTENSSSAKFCRSCGVPFSDTAVADQKEQNISPVKIKTAPHSASTAQKKRGGRLIAIVTAFAVFLGMVFGYPGFLRRKPGTEEPSVHPAAESSGTEDLLDAKYQAVKAAEGILTTENRTLREGGIAVTVENGFLGEAAERELTVNRLTGDLSYSFDGEEEIPLTVYEVNIDGIQSGSMITIELPMDKEVAPLYGAGYIDEKTGEVKPALNTYDPASGILTIHTTHLTKFCGIPVKNEKTRNAVLAYVSGWDLMDEENLAAIDNQSLLSAMEESLANGGESLSVGISVMDQLGYWQGGLSAVNSMAGVPDTSFVMQGTAAANGFSAGIDGMGTQIFMSGNKGTIGTVMNTNFGKAGTMSLSSEFGWSPQRVVKYDDKLKAVYPSGTISSIGKFLNAAGNAMSLLRLSQNIAKDGLQSASAASEATKWAASAAMDLYLKYGTYTAGLGVYMTGVGLFAITLDYMYTTALEGRKEAYIHAYQKYYSGPGHWTDDDFIAAFRKAAENGGTKDDIMQVVDDYVNRFWNEADNGSADYLASILTEDDRHAWGIEAQAGLTEEIKKEISDNYKARLIKNRLPGIFSQIEYQKQMELVEKYEEAINEARKRWNRVVKLSITSSDMPDNKEDSSAYEGCIVRFKGLEGKVSDPESWQTVLNREGSGEIRFTLLAHMLANAGNEIEIVRIENGKEKVLLTDTFGFKDDLERAYGAGLYAQYRIEGIPEEKSYPVTEVFDHEIMIPTEDIATAQDAEISYCKAKYLYFNDISYADFVKFCEAFEKMPGYEPVVSAKDLPKDPDSGSYQPYIIGGIGPDLPTVGAYYDTTWGYSMYIVIRSNISSLDLDYWKDQDMSNIIPEGDNE